MQHILREIRFARTAAHRCSTYRVGPREPQHTGAVRTALSPQSWEGALPLAPPGCPGAPPGCRSAVGALPEAVAPPGCPGRTPRACERSHWLPLEYPLPPTSPTVLQTNPKVVKLSILPLITLVVVLLTLVMVQLPIQPITAHKSSILSECLKTLLSLSF